MTTNLTVKVLPKFPARVVAGVGAAITKLNGIWTFSFSSSTIPAQPVTDPGNTEILVEMPDGTLGKVPLTAALATVAPVQQTGKRNALINGGFNVWQRGTGFVPTTARMMTADRWGVKTGAGTLTTAARATTLQPGLRGPYGIIIQGAVGVTTVDIDQRIEAINAAVLRAPPPFVTFSARIINTSGSGLAPTLFVETPNALDTWTTSAVQNGGGAGEGLQSCPNGVMTTVTWSADISAYANLANGLGFRLRFPSGALDSNTKAIEIHDVQVEVVNAVNDPPSLFEVETFSDELARCQRYYFKTFPYVAAPAQNAGISGGFTFVQIQVAGSAQNGNGFRWLAVMRTNPAITLYNPSATNGQIRNASKSTDWTGSASVNGSDVGAQISGTAVAGSVLGDSSIVHITADAEL